jgi:MFS family permease
MPTHDITAPLQTPTAQVVMGLLVALLALPLVLEVRKIPVRLLVLMATAFVDMVGLLILVPLLPFYVLKFAPEGIGQGYLHIGPSQLAALVAVAFTLTQSIASPFWGRYADRHGRKPALLIALGMSALAYLVFGFAHSLWLLALSRVVQGAGGGTVGVIQAYVADTTKPEDRAKALGWLSAATNLGVSLGPVIGHYAFALRDVDFAPGESHWTMGDAAPGIVAALICVVNLGFAARLLSESNTNRAAAPSKHTTPRGAAWLVLRQPRAVTSRLIWTYAIAIGSQQGVNVVLGMFLSAQHGVTESTIGYFWTYLGAISVFARALLLGKMLDRFGEAKLSRIGLVTLALGLAGLPLANSLPTLALAVGLIPLGTAFTFPCVTGLLSKVIPSTERGLYMGLQQTYGGFTRIAGPLFFGTIYDHMGHREPYWFAAAFVLMTLPLGVGLDAYARKPKGTSAT